MKYWCWNERVHSLGPGRGLLVFNKDASTTVLFPLSMELPRALLRLASGTTPSRQVSAPHLLLCGKCPLHFSLQRSWALSQPGNQPQAAGRAGEWGAVWEHLSNSLHGRVQGNWTMKGVPGCLYFFMLSLPRECNLPAQTSPSQVKVGLFTVPLTPLFILFF